MRKALLFYNLIIVSVIALTGMINAGGLTNEMGYSILFIPLAVYFSKELFKPSQTLKQAMAAKKQQQNLSPTWQATENRLTTLEQAGELAENFEKQVTIDEPVTGDNQEALEPELMNKAQVRDINRRLFLRLIGTAGLGTFLMSVFTKEAQAAFFGSVPGPGTVGIKDSSGKRIDPAVKQPTDGYRVNEVDDAALPSYYGFVNKDGEWYIAREDSSGSWRYSKGSTGFSTNWTGRAALSYDYFDVTF